MTSSDDEKDTQIPIESQILNNISENVNKTDTYDFSFSYRKDKFNFLSILIVEGFINEFQRDINMIIMQEIIHLILYMYGISEWEQKSEDIADQNNTIERLLGSVARDDFTLNWNHIANALRHELYDKISVVFTTILKKK
eukprot:163140_1